MSAALKDENTSEDNFSLTKDLVNKQALEIYFLKLENSLEQRFNKISNDISSIKSELKIDISSIKTDLKWHWWVLVTLIGLTVAGFGTVFKLLFDIVSRIP